MFAKKCHKNIAEFFKHCKVKYSMARINWSVFRNVLLTIVMYVPKVQNNLIFNLFVVTLLRYQVYFRVVVLAEAYVLIL